MRRPPSLRNNNGALQVRVRLEGSDHFINRLGRWDDPVAVARAQALSARIWSDAKAGSLDLSLKSYRAEVLRAEKEIAAELPLDEALRVNAERSRQAVVIHSCPSDPVAVWSTAEDCCRGAGVCRLDAGRGVERSDDCRGAGSMQELQRLPEASV